MSTSTRKIVAGLLTFAMVLTLVVGLTAAPASAQTVEFTRNLTVGSRGADVMQLQTILQAKGFFTTTPTGYFGTITKRAVAAWQASEGISPAAGYFGPISRAQIGGGDTTTPTTPVTNVPGCPAGAVYNYLTGALCATTPTSPAGSTTEGSLTINRAPSVVSNSNIQSNTDVPVYGLQLQAKLGDVKVDRFDLDIIVNNNGSFENPGTFINTIKVWDGSTLVKSFPVGSNDFNTGTTTSDYYVRLSGIGFVVPKDATKNFIITFSTNGGIDVSRALTLSEYNSNALLTTSGNNVVSYYDPGVTFSQTFTKPGTANLTVAADASNPVSTTYRINKTSSGVTNATFLTFTVKSDTGDSKITSVTVLATSSNTTGPTALYLYDGSTILGSYSLSASASAQTATFNNLSLVVPKDTTKVLTITGDMQQSTADNTIASTTVSAVAYQKPNGSSANASFTAIAGNNQYFYSVSPQWTLLSAGTPTALTRGTSGTLDGVSQTFVLKAKPLGGTMDLPVTTDFLAELASSTAGNLAITSAAAVTVNGNPTSLAEGSEYTVNVTFTVASTSLKAGVNTVWFKLTSASSTIGSTSTVQTWGLGNFQSAPVTYTK